MLRTRIGIDASRSSPIPCRRSFHKTCPCDMVFAERQCGYWPARGATASAVGPRAEREAVHLDLRAREKIGRLHDFRESTHALDRLSVLHERHAAARDPFSLEHRVGDVDRAPCARSMARRARSWTRTEPTTPSCFARMSAPRSTEKSSISRSTGIENVDPGSALALALGEARCRRRGARRDRWGRSAHAPARDRENEREEREQFHHWFVHPLLPACLGHDEFVIESARATRVCRPTSPASSPTSYRVLTHTRSPLGRPQEA